MDNIKYQQSTNELTGGKNFHYRIRNNSMLKIFAKEIS